MGRARPGTLPAIGRRSRLTGAIVQRTNKADNRAVRIGCSGYNYPHWRGVFYPDDLPKKHWFDHYVQHFDCVEINNTFYKLPGADTFDRWREHAPPHFVYALKLSRYGTHQKRLKDPQQWIGNFTQVADRLGEHLGPILAQLPPNWKPDPDRLAAFLDADSGRHRWAIEVRDERWLVDEVYSVLREHGAALCWHDMIDGHPHVDTADFVYWRFHGSDRSRRYAGSYSPQALAAHAGRLAESLAAGREVYAFFNNDEHGCAVQDAQRLRRYLADRVPA